MSKTLTLSDLRAIRGAAQDTRTLGDVLRQRKISYGSWYAACRRLDFSAKVPRGRRATTYTQESLQAVRALVAKGEFLSKACAKLGLNYPNFLRWCRRQGIAAITKQQRARNVKRQYEQLAKTTSASMTRAWAKRKRLGILHPKQLAVRDRDAAIIRAHRQGKTKQALASRYRLTLQSISRIVKPKR